MTKITLGTLTFISAWFMTASLIIVWISSASNAAFDPNMRLSKAIMSLSFEQELIASLADIAGQPAAAHISALPTIYHFTQGQCYCEYAASAHQSSLQQWSEAHGFKNIRVDINAYPQLAGFIPSTPAVLVVNENKELMYLGPYSRGSGCFANSGEVDALLAKWINTQTELPNFSNAIIELDASGCYCETQKQPLKKARLQ